MKVYYQGIMDYLDKEIRSVSTHDISLGDDSESYKLRGHKLSVLQDVRDNINRIIREEHQKMMEEQKQQEKLTDE